MRRYAVLFTGLLLGLVAGVGVQAQAAPLKIVATTTQAYDLVTMVAQGVPAAAVNITGLMGAGVDPHLYKPTEADIAALNAADVIVYMGLNLEGQFDEVFQALAQRGVTIFALSDPVQAAGFVITGFEATADDPGVDDPHFWFDPRNWQMSALALAEVLAAADADHAAQYRQNAADYATQLDLLYAWALEGMASVPAAQRYLVTSHDAFQYFGQAFGWQVAAVQGISTVQEAGVGDIQSAVQTVIEQQIPVLFVESSVPPTTIRAVQEAVAAAGSEVQTAPRELYSDAMGDADSYAGTYVGMIASNVYTILQAYQAAGVDLTIPPYPEDLLPAPPEDLLAGTD